MATSMLTTESFPNASAGPCVFRITKPNVVGVGNAPVGHANAAVELLNSGSLAACPSPKPHPTRSGAPRSVNPSTGPRPRAWLEVGRPASLDRRPCHTGVAREDGERAGWAA